MDTKATTARRAASIAIAVVGVVHLVLAKEQFDAKAYVGVLFIAGGVAALYVALRLWFAHDVIAWTLGAIVAAGMFIGFVLSRTTGLPGFKEPDWETSGIVTLVLEAAYLGALAFCARRREPHAVSRPAAGSGWWAADQADAEARTGMGAARR